MNLFPILIKIVNRPKATKKMINFSFLLDFFVVIIYILGFFLIFTVNFLPFPAFLENLTFVKFIVEVCSPL